MLRCGVGPESGKSSENPTAGLPIRLQKKEPKKLTKKFIFSGKD